MKKNLSRILGGLLLIAIAVAIILGSVGIGFELPAGIAVWQWIVGICLLFALFDAVRRLEFISSFLILGFEVMVFEPQIGELLGLADENWISNWLILLVSLLLGIGVSMMVKGFKLFSFRVKKNTLGSSVKYIDCTNMKDEAVYNKMGYLEVRFENLCNFEKNVTLTAHNTLGAMEIYVPAHWNVKVISVNTLGDISIDEAFKNGSVNHDGQPVLTIKAYNKLGDMEIIAQ